MRIREASVMAFLLAVLVAGCDDGGATGSPDAGPNVDVPNHECSYDEQCTEVLDGLEGTCERAVCNGGTCETAPRPAGVDCEAEGAGECQRGACNSEGQCVVSTARNGTACRTSEWTDCTGFKCQDGSCEEVSLLDCDDENPCTADSCDPSGGGSCVHEPIEGSCDDGNPCTKNDTCQDGECVGQANDCECTSDDECAAMDDDNACNGVLVCDESTNQCVTEEGSEVTCEPLDGSPCLENVCDPETGSCEVQPVENGTPCDDGDPCTGCIEGTSCEQPDTCQSGECTAGEGNPCECEGDADCQPLDDGNPCNGVWTCDDGTCVEDPDGLDCSDQDTPPCQEAFCDPETGSCMTQPVDDGTACDDGEPCTVDESCQDGSCTPGGFDCEVDCGDGMDEDGDGSTDCGDEEDCGGTAACSTE